MDHPPTCGDGLNYGKTPGVIGAVYFEILQKMLNLGSFWGHFGVILDQFWVDFGLFRDHFGTVLQ